jgi:hypothetical protein
MAHGMQGGKSNPSESSATKRCRQQRSKKEADVVLASEVQKVNMSRLETWHQAQAGSLDSSFLQIPKYIQ